MNIPLNIDWQQILLHFFNFSILVGGLYLLLFKPVKSFMEKREKHYADMEAAAVAREKDTEALKAAMAQREADFDADCYEKCGNTLKRGDTVINFHIPSAGPLTDEKRLDSYKQAYKFFGGKDGEPMAFVCGSWLP